MNNFTILETGPFEEQFDRLSQTSKIRVEKLILQLAEKGNQVGKPLGYSFLREKKFNGNRLYFLVYEEWKTIYSLL